MNTPTEFDDTKIGYSIPGLARAVETSVSNIRKHIDKGNLVVRYVSPKAPRIATDEAKRWFESLPTERPLTDAA